MSAEERKPYSRPNEKRRLGVDCERHDILALALDHDFLKDCPRGGTPLLFDDCGHPRVAVATDPETQITEHGHDSDVAVPGSQRAIWLWIEPGKISAVL